MVRAETTFGQDLAFTVTNTISDGSRVLQLEILAVQMETSRDDGVTMSFDSGNQAIFAEDSPVAERLQKLVGLRLAFHLSAENRVTRVDGAKELAERVSGNNNPVRGVAGGVLSRFVNPQFFTELVEMGMLPKEPVKIGDTWTVSRQASAGLWGTSPLLNITYKFRGWQQHDGTNCARLDFSGSFKPNPAQRTNQAVLRKVMAMANPQNVEEGTITGRSWFGQEISLAAETIYDQSITSKSTTVRRPRVTAGASNAAGVAASVLTNAAPSTNLPSPTSTTTTTTTQQHTRIKLVEVEPWER